MSQSAMILSIAVAIPALVGCSGRASRIEAPAIDPQGAAEQAMGLYDADADGNLSEAELKKCPAIQSALTIYDTNSDKAVTSEEIAARLQRLLDERNGLLMLHAMVTLDKRPLSGATIKFVPEAIVAEAIKPAQGQTDANGRCMPAIAPEDSPTPSRSVQAIQPGLYRVEITHSSKTLPPRYNVNSELGVDVSYRQMDSGISFDLNSR